MQDWFLLDVSTPRHPNTFAKVSECDRARIESRKWYAAASGYKGALYVHHCFQVAKIKRTVKLHRFILDAPPGFHVDHINGDPMDNRRENLRVCTAQQNQGNSRKLKPGQSQYKGVAWCAGANKWRAYIAKDRRQRHLGLFKEESAAAAAYDAAAREAFGEYACLNLRDERVRVDAGQADNRRKPCRTRSH